MALQPVGHTGVMAVAEMLRLRNPEWGVVVPGGVLTSIGQRSASRWPLPCHLATFFQRSSHDSGL